MSTVLQGSGLPAQRQAEGWFGNAAAAGLLALCPLLAAGNTLLTALAIGAAFVMVLCGSAVSVAFCRRLIAPGAEPLCLLLITATWVTGIDLLQQAGIYPIREQLGIYVPLLAGNFLLLAHLDETALLRTPVAALRESFPLGLRAAVVVIAAGVLRELATTGTLLSDAVLMRWQAPPVVLPVKLPLFASAAGAFFALSILIAAGNRLRPERAVD